MYIEGIEIELVRKNIKNINLSVNPPDGHVRVSAPYFADISLVESFVASKLDWIRAHREKYENRPVIPPCEYLSGDTVYLFGRALTLFLDEDLRRGAVIREEDRLILGNRGGSTSDDRERYINEWLRGELARETEYLMPVWEERTGLHPSSWQIKNMTTRWGTCNTKTKKIWLNLQLSKKPPECLEYVILHELTHLKIRDHGPRFKAEMDEYMPDWRAIKQKLNERQI